jgi:hypothetical protein
MYIFQNVASTICGDLRLIGNPNGLVVLGEDAKCVADRAEELPIDIDKGPLDFVKNKSQEVIIKFGTLTGYMRCLRRAFSK